MFHHGTQTEELYSNYINFNSRNYPLVFLLFCLYIYMYIFMYHVLKTKCFYTVTKTEMYLPYFYKYLKAKCWSQKYELNDYLKKIYILFKKY